MLGRAAVYLPESSGVKSLHKACFFIISDFSVTICVSHVSPSTCWEERKPNLFFSVCPYVSEFKEIQNLNLISGTHIKTMMLKMFSHFSLTLVIFIFPHVHPFCSVVPAVVWF